MPPLSGSTVDVFHRLYENRVLRPNFFEQPAPRHLADITDESEHNATGEHTAHLGHARARQCPVAMTDEADSGA